MFDFKKLCLSLHKQLPTILALVLGVYIGYDAANWNTESSEREITVNAESGRAFFTLHYEDNNKKRIYTNLDFQDIYIGPIQVSDGTPPVYQGTICQVLETDSAAVLATMDWEWNSKSDVFIFDGRKYNLSPIKEGQSLILGSGDPEAEKGEAEKETMKAGSPGGR